MTRPSSPSPSSRPDGSEYVRVGFTVLPRWLPWLVAALVVVGGGGAAVLIASTPTPGERVAGAPSGLPEEGGAGAWTPPAALPPSVPAPSMPTELPSVTPSDLPSAAVSGPAPAPAEPSPGDPDDPDDPDENRVVEAYYRELADGDFAAAWERGGKYIAHTSYAKWVAGYDTTASISLGRADAVGGGRVRVVIRALQTDGTARTYGGTYTVSGGVIVGADVSEQ
ncbi:hypothetical protein ACGFXC_07645 [Streptomyces sp. NPDC048507]|uniref:hypothetical protein n=1 Tax=Streptomyces sp. NPDC048507 TaxID=3365560 RepID=UPI003723BAA7